MVRVRAGRNHVSLVALVNSHFGRFRSEADMSAYKKWIYGYTLAPAPPLVPTGTASALAAGERRAAHRVMPGSQRKPT